MNLSRLWFAFFVIAFTSVDAHAYWADVVSSGSGVGTPAAAASECGVVIAWSDDGEIVARKYSPHGVISWTGVLATSGGTAPQIVAQGSDCYVAWLEATGHVLKIKKVSSNGGITASATLDSTVVSGASSLVMAPRSGGGVTVGWVVSNVGYVRLYAADLDGSSHVAAKFNDGYVSDLHLVDDYADGVIAAWVYGTYPYGVRGSRVSSTGAKLWSNPTSLIEGSFGDTASYLQAASDQAGGAVIVAKMGWLAYAQHVDEDGTTYWDDEPGYGPYGRPVAIAVFNAYGLQLAVNSSATAAVVSWEHANFEGSAASLNAQRLPLTGSFARQWGIEGVEVAGLDYHAWYHRSVAVPNDQTAFTRVLYNDPSNLSTLDYRVIDDDGNSMFTPSTLYQQFPVYSLGNAIAVSALVGHALGAYVPWRLYENGTWAVHLASVSWPIFNASLAWDPDRCRSTVTWTTPIGSSANKLQYGNNGNWTTKNATGSGGTYQAVFLHTLPTDYRVLTTLNGVEYISCIYRDGNACDEPTPEGSPMADNRVREVYLTAHPNPFNPQVAIDFHLPAASDVSLAIFDISGRQVKMLVSGMKPAGHHSATWQGNDDSGEPVSSGVYFGRLTVDGKTFTHKLVMLK